VAYQVKGEVPLELETVYRVYGPLVERWVCRLGGPSSDLEDLVQEVFIKVDRLLPGFRGEAKLTTWLYRITENVVGHARRKQRFRRWLIGSSENVAATLEKKPELGLFAPSPAEDLEQRETAALVYRVLDGLPDKYRTLLILFELEGLSGEELCELTGLKRSTLWVRLHRAREKFVERMKKLAPAEVQALESLRVTATGGAR
jgi:RNA polymerase sigma-70 factor (ECF subfamily)